MSVKNEVLHILEALQRKQCFRTGVGRLIQGFKCRVESHQIIKG